MRDDPSVVALVVRARDGDQTAWDDLVERYAPLVWSICGRFRLSRLDIDDVAQSVWMRLVERLAVLREPAALPGWLATTTQRECLRVIRVAQRSADSERAFGFDTVRETEPDAVDHDILEAERDAALRQAFSELGEPCRALLGMLIEDPPVPYSSISARLGMPVGSIGPNRSRCLDALRRRPALAGFVERDHPTAKRR
jgi:RNA polymerase sigma factor (sigma-70 family)